MAKSRIIQTRLWTDDYIQELNTTEKLLYIYLMTNNHTNIAGIYEISLRTIEFESGIKKETILKTINRLSKDKKIFYINQKWVVLINFIKNQQINPKVRKGIEIAINSLPQTIKDRLSIDYQTLCISFDNINLNSNSNLNSNNLYIGTHFIVSEELHNSITDIYTIKKEILIQEYKKADLWITNNPSKKKSNYNTYITNWINRYATDKKIKPVSKPNPPKEVELV